MQLPLYSTEKANKFLQKFNLKAEPTPENLISILNSIDYTSLESTDDNSKIVNMVKQVKKLVKLDPKLNVATICVYPNFTKPLSKLLKNTKVNTAVVAGAFPSAQAIKEVKVLEVKNAVLNGAEEVDVVLNPALIITKRYKKALSEIKVLKKACGKKAKLKVIIESGALQNQQQVFEASIIALKAGADFIKTSTGKVQIGATKESFTTMLFALKWYAKENNEKPKGIKASGGIKSIEDAMLYVSLYESFFEENISPKKFRIGASSLLTNILNALSKQGFNVSLQA